MKFNRKRVFLFVFVFAATGIYAQINETKIIWDKQNNIPVSYATITDTKNVVFSNENGYFDFVSLKDNITIQNINYHDATINEQFLKTNDTVYLSPKSFVLDEMVIEQDSRYTKMIKSVLKNYAFEPHKEQFFLRVVVRKNNELHKIVDLTGKLEKLRLKIEMLFIHLPRLKVF